MRVYIVDDAPVVRVGLAQVLATEPGVTIVGWANSARDAFRELDHVRADLVTMDLILPGMDGVAATRELKRRQPQIRVVVYSIHPGARDLRAAFEAGASAYVRKTEPLESLLAGMAAAMRGETYVSPSLTLQSPEAPLPTDVLKELSVREQEIFQFMIAGGSIAQTAQEYCISPRTVEVHLYHVYRKLGCNNRADLMRFAADHDLLRIRPTLQGQATPEP